MSVARPFVTLLLASVALLLPPVASGRDAGAQEATAPEDRWLGPEGQPLPFESDEEILAFLRTAEVVSRKELTGGINRPLKVRLRQDGVEANAIFRIVDVRRRRAKLDGKLIPDFHDSHIYECAAWEVSRLLGIDNVPPCVERRFEASDGTMQLWVEDAMTEKERRERGVQPPQQLQWIRQKQTMRLFDALIYNFDRNQGNMLIDSDWKLWFIDHTRSFRKSAVVEKLEKITWCERGIFERLRELERKTLSAKLRSKVTGVQVSMLLKRRDKLVRHLDSLIEDATESAVLWDASSPVESSDELLQMATDDDIPVTSSMLEEPGDDIPESSSVLDDS